LVCGRLSWSTPTLTEGQRLLFWLRRSRAGSSVVKQSSPCLCVSAVQITLVVAASHAEEYLGTGVGGTRVVIQSFELRHCFVIPDFVIRYSTPQPVMILSVFQGKPIIGIAGGIGSGKSFVARLFGEMGCLVIHADDQVRQAYGDPEIQKTLERWWGREIYREDGNINRPEVARRIFSSPQERVKLERLLHPWIARQRDRLMEESAKNPRVLAFIWDTPLLFETGLEQDCDAVVFVDAPEDTRFQRVSQTRGWDPDEIIRREKLQWPLDKKKKMSHYVVVNTADAAASRSQVRKILSRILEN
jgi:dephospho-CoA kinase